MGRYVPNRDADDEIASSLGMKNLMNDTAHLAWREVKAAAPRGSSGRGAYRHSIRSGTVLESDGWHGRVGSISSFWHLIEFGSVNNPAYAPLRRGVERVLRRTRRTPKGSG